MDDLELYDARSRERIVAEPPKRVEAPERTPFERDRARVVHAASSRRLAAKTQVVGPASDDFVRNRLTHSLEVAQVARDLSRALGSQPDIAETAALAHDLGHPPFGHNGEKVLARLGEACGGFEGNAQTLRVLTRLEAKTFGPDGASAGLNLTRATLDACTKYPWARGEGPEPAKFGVYADDRATFDWLREGAPAPRRCLEAQVMDLADDVAYSVHDVEDGTVAGHVDLTRLDTAAVWSTLREWYLPDAGDDELDAGLARLRTVGSWPTAAHDGSRRSLAALKNLTSDVIGRFCGDVQAATFAAAGGAGGAAMARYGADLVVPRETWIEITVLKAVAAHYVMQTPDRLAIMERQRTLLAELVAAMTARAPDVLDRPFADDWAAADDDAARLRVVIDQVASLTDPSAVARHARLVGGERSVSEPLVWLPFDPADLGEVPTGLHYEVVDPTRRVPDSVSEVALYVPPYRLDASVAEVLPQMGGLRVVQTLTAGVDAVLPAVPPGVTLCSGRGIHDASTAELALTLVLASLRGVPDFVRDQDRRAWRPQWRPALADKHVMIVGYGAIGEAIEVRLLPFEVTVTRVARRARDGVHAIDDLPGLLPTADVVVLVLPLTDASRGLVDADFLSRLKDGALLVNVARGPVVDTPALLAELRTGRITAAVDVVDTEPLPPDAALWDAPGLLVSPHVGGASSAMWPRAHRLVREQLQRFANDEPLANVVER